MPEPQQIWVAEILDPRRTGLGQDGVEHDAAQFGDTGAAFSFRGERIVEDRIVDPDNGLNGWNMSWEKWKK